MKPATAMMTMVFVDSPVSPVSAEPVEGPCSDESVDVPELPEEPVEVPVGLANSLDEVVDPFTEVVEVPVAAPAYAVLHTRAGIWPLGFVSRVIVGTRV